MMGADQRPASHWNASQTVKGVRAKVVNGSRELAKSLTPSLAALGLPLSMTWLRGRTVMERAQRLACPIYLTPGLATLDL